jgi:hypothetical protein
LRKVAVIGVNDARFIGPFHFNGQIGTSQEKTYQGKRKCECEEWNTEPLTLKKTLHQQNILFI